MNLNKLNTIIFIICAALVFIGVVFWAYAGITLSVVAFVRGTILVFSGFVFLALVLIAES
jgi:hypothetical protein